jgi:hypothetical protein
MNPNDWKALEDAAQERINSIEKGYKERNWALTTDTVEDISFDWDEDGLRVTLEGDFVYSMLKYLVTNEEDDPMYNKIILKLDGYCIDECKKEFR